MTNIKGERDVMGLSDQSRKKVVKKKLLFNLGKTTERRSSLRTRSTTVIPGAQTKNRTIALHIQTWLLVLERSIDGSSSASTLKSSMMT